MFIFNSIKSAILSAGSEFVQWLTPVLTYMFKLTTDLFDLPFVQAAVNYTKILATVLLILLILKDIMTYVYGMADSDASPTIIIKRAVYALLAVWAAPQAMTYIIEFASKVSSDISNVFSAGNTPEAYLKAIADKSFIEKAGASASINLVDAIIGLALCISIAVVVYQMVKRCVELVLMQIIGPPLCISLATNNGESATNWFRNVAAATLGQCLQIFMVQALLYLYLTPKLIVIAGKPVNGVMLSIFTLTWSLMCIFIPKFLEKFMMPSGGRGGQIVGQAINAGMSALKSLKK